jgi:hypothetical protein
MGPWPLVKAGASRKTFSVTEKEQQEQFRWPRKEQPRGFRQYTFMIRTPSSQSVSSVLLRTHLIPYSVTLSLLAPLSIRAMFTSFNLSRALVGHNRCPGLAIDANDRGTPSAASKRDALRASTST